MQHSDSALNLSPVSYSVSHHALLNTAAWHAEKPFLKTAAHTHPSLHWTPIILIVCTTQLALHYILSCSLIVSTTQFSTLLHSVRFCNCVMYFCLVLPPIYHKRQGGRGRVWSCFGISHSTKHCSRNNKVGLRQTLALLVGGWVGRLVDWHSDGLYIGWVM